MKASDSRLLIITTDISLIRSFLNNLSIQELFKEILVFLLWIVNGGGQDYLNNTVEQIYFLEERPVLLGGILQKISSSLGLNVHEVVHECLYIYMK